jgi:hypothetical protein
MTTPSHSPISLSVVRVPARTALSTLRRAVAADETAPVRRSVLSRFAIPDSAQSPGTGTETPGATPPAISPPPFLPAVAVAHAVTATNEHVVCRPGSSPVVSQAACSLVAMATLSGSGDDGPPIAAVTPTPTVAPIGVLRTMSERSERRGFVAFEEPDGSQAEALALDHIALIERVASDLRLTPQEVDELRLSARRVVRGVRRLHGNVRGAISVLQRGYVVPNVLVEFGDVMGPHRDDAA